MGATSLDVRDAGTGRKPKNHVSSRTFDATSIEVQRCLSTSVMLKLLIKWAPCSLISQSDAQLFGEDGMTILETFSNYLRDRRALEELRKLDDRMLADIGLRGVDLKSALKSRGRTGERASGPTAR